MTFRVRDRWSSVLVYVDRTLLDWSSSCWGRSRGETAAESFSSSSSLTFSLTSDSAAGDLEGLGSYSEIRTRSLARCRQSLSVFGGLGCEVCSAATLTLAMSCSQRHQRRRSVSRLSSYLGEPLGAAVKSTLVTGKA
jgi:hypothetical protein